MHWKHDYLIVALLDGRLGRTVGGTLGRRSRFLGTGRPCSSQKVFPVRRSVAEEGGQCAPVFRGICRGLGVISISSSDLLDQLEDVDKVIREGVAPPFRGRGILENRNQKWSSVKGCGERMLHENVDGYNAKFVSTSNNTYRSSRIGHIVSDPIAKDELVKLGEVCGLLRVGPKLLCCCLHVGYIFLIFQFLVEVFHLLQ